MSDHLIHRYQPIYSFSPRKKRPPLFPVPSSSLQFPPVPHRKRLLKITLVMSDHLIHRYHPIYSFSRRKKGPRCSQFPPVPSSSPQETPIENHTINVRSSDSPVPTDLFIFSKKKETPVVPSSLQFPPVPSSSPQETPIENHTCDVRSFDSPVPSDLFIFSKKKRPPLFPVPSSSLQFPTGNAD